MSSSRKDVLEKFLNIGGFIDGVKVTNQSKRFKGIEKNILIKIPFKNKDGRRRILLIPNDPKGQNQNLLINLMKSNCNILYSNNLISHNKNNRTIKNTKYKDMAINTTLSKVNLL